MIKNRPIQNVDSPPYFFKIRGRYFMEFILICSGLLLMGILGGIVLSIVGSTGTGGLCFIAALILCLCVYRFYVHRSRFAPFKQIGPLPDLISHIGFNTLMDDNKRNRNI